jgi:hypothetical protein
MTLLTAKDTTHDCCFDPFSARFEAQTEPKMLYIIPKSPFLAPNRVSYPPISGQIMATTPQTHHLFGQKRAKIGVRYGLLSSKRWCAFLVVKKTDLSNPCAVNSLSLSFSFLRPSRQIRPFASRQMRPSRPRQFRCQQSFVANSRSLPTVVRCQQPFVANSRSLPTAVRCQQPFVANDHHARFPAPLHKPHPNSATANTGRAGTSAPTSNGRINRQPHHNCPSRLRRLL